MNLTRLLLFGTLLATSMLEAMTMDQFKKLLNDNKAGKVPRQTIIMAYDTYRQNIDVELAKNAIRVILNTTIDRLRQQEAGVKTQEEARLRAQAEELEAQYQRERSEKDAEIARLTLLLQQAQASQGVAQKTHLGAHTSAG